MSRARRIMVAGVLAAGVGVAGIGPFSASPAGALSEACTTSTFLGYTSDGGSLYGCEGGGDLWLEIDY